MGTPKFAGDILRKLIEKHEVVCVVTQPDAYVGRKKILTFSDAKKVALDFNIPVYQPIKLSLAYDYLLTLDAQLIVTAAYGQMLPKGLLNHFKAINVHGSILPNYRGGAPIQYALFDGLKETGVSIMWMAQKMDSGDVIKYEFVNINEEDNFETLADKLSIAGASALLEVLETFEQEGYVTSTPQVHEHATFAYNISRLDEFVDFREKAVDIKNKLRGLLPTIGISFKIKDYVIKIFELRLASDIILGVPAGTIVLNKKMYIQADDDVLEIIKVQVPGKKIMEVKDFLNGQMIIKNYDVVTRKGELNV